MAAPRRGASPAPTKKQNKSHGPKRHMFHDYNKALRIAFGQAGMLNKYHNRESFDLACTARGVRNCLNLLWNEYILLPTKKEKDLYLATIAEHEKNVQAKMKK